MPDLMTRFDNKSGKLREIDNRKIYKNARHEILNEDIKDQVTQDILKFLEK